MPARRGRTKKLIVAFHFQFANQAAWKCDECRKSGLEKSRRCGWLSESAQPVGAPVWVRKGVALTSCPVSQITPQSLGWIEEYVAWKVLGGLELHQLPARTVEAFCILENEAAKETNNGER